MRTQRNADVVRIELNDEPLFRVDIGMIKQTYLDILEVISLMPDPEMSV